MQLPKSQQTLLMVQSACIVGLCMAAKYFNDLLQPRALKSGLKGGKFRNGILPSSCKDMYHLQDGQVMLSRSFLHFSCLLFSEQDRKRHKAEVKGHVLCCCLRQLSGWAGWSLPVINAYSLLATSN